MMAREEHGLPVIRTSPAHGTAFGIAGTGKADPSSMRAALRWAAGRTAKTKAAEVGTLTLSMLRGESGNQTAELEEHKAKPEKQSCR